MAPEWWSGPDAGWLHVVRPVPILANGQSELTIHFDAHTQQFIEIQTTDFGASDLAFRVAGDIIGPWSPPAAFYRPPEYARRNAMIYSAKAHPQLDGADLVVTYSNNSFEFSEHLSDSSIYYPRFVRMQSCNRKQ